MTEILPETDTATRRSRFPVVPLLVLGGMGYGLFAIQQCGARRRDQKQLLEFYRDVKIDTVRDAHGNVDMDQSHATMSLRHADSLRHLKVK